MAIVSILLDPAAVVYTDDEIVGKINAAAVNISRADAVESAAVDLSGKDTDALTEGAVNKYDTGPPPTDLDEVPDSATRFAAAEANAKDDLDGGEIRDLVKGLADGEREIVLTAPITAEHRVISVEVDGDLKLKADYDETAES